MPRQTAPRWAVQAAITAGQSASESLRLFREAGGAIRTQSWYRMYGLVEQERVAATTEAARPLHRVPTATEIQPRPSRRPGAYHQEVSLIVRDRNGEVELRQIAVRTPKLMSRRRAIEVASEGWQDPSKYKGWQAVGAIYFGTFELEPIEE